MIIQCKLDDATISLELPSRVSDFLSRAGEDEQAHIIAIIQSQMMSFMCLSVGNLCTGRLLPRVAEILTKKLDEASEMSQEVLATYR